MMSLERRSFLMSMSGSAAQKGRVPDHGDERELVLKLVSEFWRRANLKVAEEMFAHDYRLHEAGRTSTREEWVESVQAMRARTPEMRISVEAVHAWPGGASWRWKLDLGGILLHGINIETIRDGRIVETWSCAQPQSGEII